MRKSSLSLESVDPSTILWSPNPGPQTRFLQSNASEICYGGAAGGGKSDALFAIPLHFVGNPRFRALYLRRESKYLAKAIQRTSEIYPQLGARLTLHPRIVWTFPSGAELWLNHCEHELDVRIYDSFEFHLNLWDELTHFTEAQYTGINARLRTTDITLPTWSRAATNPGGTGHEWVFQRFAPWLNPKYPHPALPGEKRWFRGSEEVPRGTPESLSRTFIPALLEDNPYLNKDDRYKAQLRQLPSVRFEQLRRGNWLVKPARKDYWDRDKIRSLPGYPPKSMVKARVRAWDFGATAKGDWSVGVRGSLLHSGLVVIEHVVRFRGPPDVVHATFAETAQSDKEFDSRTVQVIPEDPGSAGKFVVSELQRRNPLITIRARRPSGDKQARFGPVSSRALQGNVAVVDDGSWDLNAYHDELDDFPFGRDDQVDATSDMYAGLHETQSVEGSLDDNNNGWMDR